VQIACIRQTGIAIMSFVGGYKKLQCGSLAVLGVSMTMPVILFVLAVSAALIRGFTSVR
jgi:hypothetical protein